ncbi:MAG: DedA family protein [Candidatus Portnoybacteria bacterium]|jgi:membrane protein DedA with SNARE-associated domain|nr:DedA family protein [Candidatus Portnoybacteria bacterium]
MISSVLVWLSSLIIGLISDAGYFGVFFLMALESACLPVPSEIIMPFAGFLVWKGQFSLVAVACWGTAGNLIGSIAAYAVGYWGGRRTIIKYGKFILISEHDLALADGWFKKYGQATVFFSRLLPVVRTFISLPAGIVKMDFKKFCFYTTVGSLPWSLALAYAGLALGENWSGLEKYFHKFDFLIGVFVVLAAAWWIFRHFRHRSEGLN